MSHNNRSNNRYKDYLTPESVHEDVVIKKFGGRDLAVVKINGTIYRGDTHPLSIIRKSPAYFGDEKSSTAYLTRLNTDRYIKAYRTVKPLTLVVVSKSNHKMLDTFFKEVLMKDPLTNKIVVKMTHILLQICYGMIDGNMDSIDLWDFSLNEIRDYFRYHESKIPKDTIDDFMKIITEYSRSDIRPSRMSIRIFDKILMKNLRVLLTRYDIQGIWFYAPDDPKYYTKWSTNYRDRKTQLCYFVDTDIYERKARTCVPNEINIFNPNKYLRKPKITKLETLTENTTTNSE